MPGRPTTRRPGGMPPASTDSNSVFKKFIKGREERRRAKQEKAAKAITNNRAQNENLIIDTLASINFVRSQLPPELLNYKSRESQPVGDLEYASRAIQKKIRDAPNFSVDTTEIDKRIYELAEDFKTAVMLGNVKAAYASKGALLTCITKVRDRIPYVKEDLVKAYIENSIKYIDTWILLTDCSREADELGRNVNTNQEKYNAKLAEVEAKNEDIKNKINNDDEYLEAFAEISERKAPANPKEWSKAMLQVRSMLVDQKLDSANLGLEMRILESERLQLKDREGRIEILSAKVGKLPIPEDPDALNKYNEEVDAIFDELAQIDTEVDELLSTIENIEGRMESLDNAPGAVHLRNAMAEQAETFIKNIQDEQQKEIDRRGVSRENLLKKLNIRSEEEQAELVKEAELERERMMLEALEQEALEAKQEEFEQESQYIYESE